MYDIIILICMRCMWRCARGLPVVHTTICVCSNYCICVLILYMCVLKLLYMCPHTKYVSAYYYMCVLKLLYVSSYYMCPHTTICVCSNYYICVLTTLYYNTRWRWARVCSS